MKFGGKIFLNKIIVTLVTQGLPPPSFCVSSLIIGDKTTYTQRLHVTFPPWHLTLRLLTVINFSARLSGTSASVTAAILVSTASRGSWGGRLSRFGTASHHSLNPWYRLDCKTVRVRIFAYSSTKSQTNGLERGWKRRAGVRVREALTLH